MPEVILGTEVARKYNNQKLLFAQVIDAHQILSIQFHFNDAMAKREHNKFGKSEMWTSSMLNLAHTFYVRNKQQITPKEYKNCVSEGTIVIVEVLAKHEVRKGDVFYLPAGRVPSICGAIRLAEIQ